MNRRTLDLLFSAGGVVLGVMLMVLGLVLNNQSNFAHNYVKDQLTAQKISFAKADPTSEEQKAAPCLVKYAGTVMDSGAKAQCYANHYIAFHMSAAATKANVPGATYATLGTEVRTATAAVDDATKAGKPQADIDKLQARVTELSGLRDTMFKGETLRGLLLTTYGFSIFGDRAGLAAIVCFAAFALMVLLSIAGFIHAASVKRHAVKVVEAPAGIVTA